MVDGNAEISFRPSEAQDLKFLRRVYASTREEELKLAPWDDADKAKFLSQQFQAQHDYYQQQFPDARFDLIVRDQAPIGRLYVDRREDEIHVIDISLLTEHRGYGIGGTIMQGILDEAAVSGKAVTIYVERNNPALRLYQRLGFRMVEEQGVHQLMEWRDENTSRNEPSQEGA